MSRVRNLDFLGNLPTFGPKLVEALKDYGKQISNLARQVNGNIDSGVQTPPQPVNAVHVTAGGGVAHVQITDNNALYRGIQYHVQYSTDPAFTAPVTVHMGPTRDIRIPVGNQPLHWRAYSDYPTSSHSDPVYHAGNTPVAATGTDQPPIPAGQGSGTGYPGQISGYGPVPFRGVTPPVRKTQS